MHTNLLCLWWQYVMTDSAATTKHNTATTPTTPAAKKQQQQQQQQKTSLQIPIVGSWAHVGRTSYTILSRCRNHIRRSYKFCFVSVILLGPGLLMVSQVYLNMKYIPRTTYKWVDCSFSCSLGGVGISTVTFSSSAQEKKQLRHLLTIFWWTDSPYMPRSSQQFKFVQPVSTPCQIE